MLIEAVISVVIAAGVMATAFEAFRVVTLRATDYANESLARALAVNIVARAGIDVPYGTRKVEADRGETIRWSVDGSVVGEFRQMRLTEVTVRVRIGPDGRSVGYMISTLKIDVDDGRGGR